MHLTDVWSTPPCPGPGDVQMVEELGGKGSTHPQLSEEAVLSSEGEQQICTAYCLPRGVR